MRVVINGSKYDTDKMELISSICQWKWTSKFGDYCFKAREVKLFKSNRGHWLLTYRTDYRNSARALTEDEAKNLLMLFDIDAYEKIFGELEEA